MSSIKSPLMYWAQDKTRKSFETDLEQKIIIEQK